MQALILAAGKGTRTGIKDIPKCLLPIGNTSIIEYQINCLREIGCDKIIVVTGYNSNKIKERLGTSIECIFNKNFENTNNLYSLWEARNFIDDEFICIYSDLLFHKKILEKCGISNKEITLAVERNLRNETMRVKIENKKIVQVNKNIDSKDTHGNFIGMAKFSKNAKNELFQIIKELIEKGNQEAYYTLAIENLVKRGKTVDFIETDNLPWMDIDTKEEIEKARKIFDKEFGGK